MRENKKAATLAFMYAALPENPLRICVNALTCLHVFKVALCSFVEEAQTQNFDIYNNNKVIIQHVIL